MTSKLRALCRGEGITPEQTAEYHQIWLRQPPGGILAGPLNGAVRPTLPKLPDTVRAITLQNHLSPGDVLVMSAAVRSLHAAHPGKFATAVDTTCPSVWDFNHDVTPADVAERNSAVKIMMAYPAIHQCNERGIHFMQAYCEFLEEKLGVRVPLVVNRPLLFISDEERRWISQVEEITKRPTRFAVVNAGRKDDATTKFWGTENFQRVVDALRGRILFVQVGAKEHHHPPLKNVLNLIGKTDVRQLIRLCWHADFGLGGVTFTQHIFAAFQKPYFCLLGGREPVQWTAYPQQQSFHTIGLLPCCRASACWKSRTVALPDNGEQNNSLCEQPVLGDEPLPRCMALIRPQELVEKILLLSA